MSSPPSSNIAIGAFGVGKKFDLLGRPHERLLHALSGGAYSPKEGIWALQDVSFELKPGRTLGIIGSNGSGKSTLLQIVAGTLAASTGQVVRTGRTAALLELGAGFNPELSGRDNVRLMTALYGLDSTQTQACMSPIESFAEIGGYIDRPVKMYSSGMFVRLAFAVIAHLGADVLVVDEALAVGDAYFQQKCMRFLHDFMERGAVLFVSHDLASVKALSSDVLWLDRGCVMDYGNPKRVSDAYVRFIYAKNQDVSLVEAARPIVEAPQMPEPEKPLDSLSEWESPDFRLASLRSLGLENQIQVFQFPTKDPGFGAGDAVVERVALLDTQGQEISSLMGGEQVRLQARLKALKRVESVIVGFFVRNRTGLNIFGDNTYLAHLGREPAFNAGEDFVARFRFVMPFLPRGDYSVCVAVATGTNSDHVQQHWVNDALMLKSLSNAVHADVFGMPMLSMEILGLR